MNESAPGGHGASATPRWLHRFAVALACGVLLLVTAGALVTSKGAGLSVPDWPLSYGSLNPPRWWQLSQVRAEHGHRLIAGTVALATLVFAFCAARREPRRWVRRLAWGAVAAVLAQALLGGLTVLFLLPLPISVGHAALAQIFLALVVTLAVVMSQPWARLAAPRAARQGTVRFAPLAAWTAGVIYLQILVGALMRHLGAGLAIPDFPLVFGGLVPPTWTLGIAVHYLHRLGALVVVAVVLWSGVRAWRHYRDEPPVLYPAMLMMGLVAAQIVLGGAVVLSGRSVPVNTAHVVTGATLWALSIVLALRSARREGGLRERPGATPQAATVRSEARA